jgi:HD-GYP domain-containing protein (c-di-GMP phosphodiesterase class II)
MLEVSESIHKSQDAESTRRMLVDAAAKATGFENIAFVRRTDVGEGVELLYQVGDVMDRTGKLRMSRTMLRNARNGTIVVSDATKSGDAAIAASLEKMSVQRAICIPVQWDKTNFGFLYLDNGKSRGDGRDEERLKEAASVADALARMAAQNLGNLSHVEEMDQIWRATLQMMVDCVEGRDPYTGGHSRRVAEFAKLLCEAAGLDAATIALIYQCGRVHDIGKITVDDAVLRKPGKLTEQEFAEIAKHPEAGHKILREHPLMRDVLPGVLEHHEKWDGTGYPHKKAGEGISLIGRIIAIADVFDAITSKRPYRDGFPLEKAMAIIQQDAGTHFDPALTKAFAKVPLQIFAEIHERIRPEVR